MSAPSLRFGKYQGVELPTVPGPYLEFLMGKPDLWPTTRDQIAAELKRRAARPSPATSDAITPKVGTAEDAEPLDSRLLGPEERHVNTRCPACGKALSMFVQLTR